MAKEGRIRAKMTMRQENPWKTPENPDGIVPISALFKKKEQPQDTQELPPSPPKSSPTVAPLEKPGDLGRGLTKAKIRYGLKWLAHYMPDIIKVAVLFVVVLFIIRIVFNMNW